MWTGIAGNKMQRVLWVFQKRGSSPALLWAQESDEWILFKSNSRRISVVSSAFCFYLLYLRVGTNSFMKHTTSSLIQERVTASCCDVFKLPFRKMASNWALLPLNHLIIHCQVCCVNLEVQYESLYNALFLMFSYVWKRKQYLIVYTFQNSLTQKDLGSCFSWLGRGKMGKGIWRLLNG